MSIKNDRLLRALLRQPVDRTPLWLMRQAGRYLPEYRKVRAQAGDFLSLCKNPELAAEVTLQPITRFGFDAAILFSDILTIPDAMGLGLHFIEGEGPVFSNPIRDEKAVIDLPILEPEEDLAYVMDAVKVIKERLNNEIPLIGFAGSPWTIACYMVEGGSSKTFSIIKGLLYKEPTILERLLDKLADAIILYLDAQIRAGVDVIMLFDTWGGILTPQAYHDFSLSYMKKIVKGLKIKNPNKAIPTILFTKGISSQQLPDLAASGCDGIGIDWTIDLADARIAVGQNVTLQGNLDPSVLYGKPELIRAEVKKILDQHRGKPGHIFNLGHGIYPDTPIEHVEVLVEAVQNY